MNNEWLQFIKKKKWWVIGTSVAVILIILVMIPVSYIRTMNNSVYDCSFTYVHPDNLVNEIARKHTYYQASDKTVDIELNQDLLNSLIKDNLASLDLALPEKVTINEVLFNTKDQRVYVNAKYGNINVPISAKMNLAISDTGVKVSADSFKIGQKDAPNFIVKRIPTDQLTYTFNYDDLNIPNIAALKDVAFGTGNVKVTLQLNTEEIANMALNYRSEILAQIDNFKNSQSLVVNNFITKLLDTGVLSEDKTIEYVNELLDDEELVNSAIYFATADDLGRYADKAKEYQEKVVAWAAPLQDLHFQGSIEDTIDSIQNDTDLTEFVSWFLPKDTYTEYVSDVDSYYTLASNYINDFQQTNDVFKKVETVKTILNDQKLNELYAMFLPKQTINDYVTTIDTYEGMAKDYLNTYENTRSAFETFVAGLDTSSLNNFSNLVETYAQETQSTKDNVSQQLAMVDTDLIQQIVKDVEAQLAADPGPAGQNFRQIDPFYYDQFNAYVNGLDETKDFALTTLSTVDTTGLNRVSNEVNQWDQFINDMLGLLKSKDYVEFVETINPNTTGNNPNKQFINKHILQGDSDISEEYNRAVQGINDLASTNNTAY